MSAPQISIWNTPYVSFYSSIMEYNSRDPKLMTPEPKQKDGNILKNHFNTSAASLVDSIILNMNKTKVRIPPIIKWKKKLKT